MSTRFTGKVAVVTGASRGIGFGIAQRLVADGAKVAITARGKDALDEAVAALGGPDHAIAIAGKSDDLEHQVGTIKATIEAFGSVDLLVNNTGINPAYGALVDLDLDAARKIVEVNCLAALSWGSRRTAPGWVSTWCDRQCVVGGRPQACARHRLLWREQGDALAHHHRARGRVRPGHPRQRGGTRRGEDEVRHRALRRWTWPTSRRWSLPWQGSTRNSVPPPCW